MKSSEPIVSDEQVAFILEFKKYLLEFKTGKRSMPTGNVAPVRELEVFKGLNVFGQRHGATEASENNELAGGLSEEESNDPKSPKNISLSRKGARATKEYARSPVGRKMKSLSRQKDTLTVSSPLKRTQQTSEMMLAIATYKMHRNRHLSMRNKLYQKPHVPFETRNGLIERNLGVDFRMPAEGGRDLLNNGVLLSGRDLLNELKYSPTGGEGTASYVRRVVKEAIELGEKARNEGKKSVYISGGHSDGLLTFVAALMASGLAEKGKSWDGTIKSYEVLELTPSASGKLTVNALTPKARPSRINTVKHRSLTQ